VQYIHAGGSVAVSVTFSQLCADASCQQHCGEQTLQASLNAFMHSCATMLDTLKTQDCIIRIYIEIAVSGRSVTCCANSPVGDSTTTRGLPG
jgi:hypothetical protein